jgi:hypothetical protein
LIEGRGIVGRRWEEGDEALEEEDAMEWRI